MTDKEFFNRLVNDKSDILQKLLKIIEKLKIEYCVIGGLTVNAYVEPVISLDLDMVVTTSEIEKLTQACSQIFEVKQFEHSINLYSPDSDLRIQIQTDSRYQSFVKKATEQKILGYQMKVAAIKDVLQGKIWAYSDKDRRKSKRQKDLADIFRIVESFPELEKVLPGDIRKM